MATGLIGDPVGQQNTNTPAPTGQQTNESDLWKTILDRYKAPEPTKNYTKAEQAWVDWQNKMKLAAGGIADLESRYLNWYQDPTALAGNYNQLGPGQTANQIEESKPYTPDEVLKMYQEGFWSNPKSPTNDPTANVGTQDVSYAGWQQLNKAIQQLYATKPTYYAGEYGSAPKLATKPSDVKNLTVDQMIQEARKDYMAQQGQQNPYYQGTDWEKWAQDQARGFTGGTNIYGTRGGLLTKMSKEVSEGPTQAASEGWWNQLDKLRERQEDVDAKKARDLFNKEFGKQTQQFATTYSPNASNPYMSGYGTGNTLGWYYYFNPNQAKGYNPFNYGQMPLGQQYTYRGYLDDQLAKGLISQDFYNQQAGVQTQQQMQNYTTVPYEYLQQLNPQMQPPVQQPDQSTQPYYFDPLTGNFVYR